MQREDEAELVDSILAVPALKTVENEGVPEMLDEVVNENRILAKEVEREENEMKSQHLIAPDNEDHESKTNELMLLLRRTHCYATHLAGKIQNHSNRLTNLALSCHNTDSKQGISGSGDTLKCSSKIDDTTTNKGSIKENKENVSTGRELSAIETKDIPPSSILSGQLDLFEGPCLKDYQIKGVEWLASLYENAVNGILADEMGLGKTVQVIALICYLLKKKVYGPYLIIAPLSTVLSWINEFKKFAPKIPTLLFYGTAECRLDLADSFEKQFVNTNISMFPVVITTYEISLREKQFFLSYTWEYIIVDEAHRLKNYRCQLSRYLKETKSNNRLLLSGTPLQNNLSELGSLLNFIMPQVFNDLAVFEKWVSVDELNESEAIVEKEAQDKIVSKIHQILSPFILRRLKSDVQLHLPPKKEILIYAPMTKLQWELYSATINGEIDYYLGKEVKDSCSLPKKRHCSSNANYVEVDDCVDDDFEHYSLDNKLKSIENRTQNTKIYRDKDGNECKIYIKMQSPRTQLRKISNHPYLVQMPLNPNNKKILIDENLVQKSGKMLVLDLLLRRLKALKHRVLLFTTMTMLLDIIEEYVILRKYCYVRLDGERCLKDRRDNIDEFTTNPDVFLFLISTRAGSLGLNLTSADTVIIYDSDWNPQVDLQAQDRCHRIGQTKPVVVYRLVTQGTIDEKIYENSTKKKKLGKLILHKDLNKENDLNKMESTISLQELQDLLKSKDYDKIVHTSGEVLSEKELEEILDRRKCSFM